MDYKIISAGETGTVILAGECTIQHAAELKDVFMKSQASAGSLLLNLEGVTGADVSFFQLLCSAHRSLVKSDRSLRLTGGIPSLLKQAATDGGYGNEACCTGADGTCLWAKIRGDE